jgi:hypothetical protein
MGNRIFTTYLQQYQAFQQQVENCLLLLRSPEAETLAIVTALQSINATFQSQLLTADDPSLPSHLLALRVEMNKQLRLLNTDAMFLRTAKTSENKQSRQVQMTDRLTLLERYCEQAIALLSELKCEG